MSNLYQSSILITRPEQKAREMAELVRKMNGQPVLFPTIEISAPDDWSETDAAIENLSGFNWLVFSSVHGVKYFLQRLQNTISQPIPSSLNIAAVGVKTEKALKEQGYHVDLIPESFTANHLLAEFEKLEITGHSVLHITGSRGRDTLPEGLRKLGAKVSVIQCYQNSEPEVNHLKKIIQNLESHDLDFLTFTSPSTFENFYDLLRRVLENPRPLLLEQSLVSIGPITTESIEKHDIAVAITSETSTIEGMLTSIAHSIETTKIQTNSTI